MRKQYPSVFFEFYVDYSMPFMIYVISDHGNEYTARADAWTAIEGHFNALAKIKGEDKLLKELPKDINPLEGCTFDGKYWGWIKYVS
jgi:hypothetical protein